MSVNLEDKTFEISLARALRQELKHIKKNTPPDLRQIPSDEQVDKLNKVFEDFHRENLSALCFSGGGIRSATFGLGIIQALAKHKLLDKFDYLSTVSGGGYMGSWLSAWIRREQIKEFEVNLIKCEIELADVQKRLAEAIADKKDKEIKELNDYIVKLNKTIAGQNSLLFEKYKKTEDAGIIAVQSKLNNHTIPISDLDSTCPNPEPTQLQFLREYSNYMSPRVGLLSADTWTLLGIYTRNLFLNWTILIPLLAAVFLLPRFLLAFNQLIEVNEWLAAFMLIIGLFAGSAAIAFVINKLPSKNTDTREIKHNNDGWVLGLGIFPLLILALTTTSFWAWYNRSEIAHGIPFEFLRPYLKYIPIGIINFLSYLPKYLKPDAVTIIIFTVSFFLLGYLLFDFTKRPRVKIDWRGIRAALVSSIIGGFLIWLIAYNLFEGASFFDVEKDNHNLPLYVCLAVPVYLLIFLSAATIFVGLSSRFVTDDDREWLARFGAWILIVCMAWLVLNGLVLFGPYRLDIVIQSIRNLTTAENFSLSETVNRIVPFVAAISGLLSLVGGFSGKSLVKDEPNKSKISKFLAVAPQIAAVVFLGFLLIGLAYLSKWLLDSVETYFQLSLTERTLILYLFVWLLGFLFIGIVMACFINVNKFSLHGAYRDRLIRAYLGASHVPRKGNKFTGFDDTDNFQLHRLRGQKPFHIINATLNLVDGKNLAWQNRKAASFTMSPLHCGSWLLGYRYSNEYSRNRKLSTCANLRYCNRFDKQCASANDPDCKLPGKALRLGTAMAISGAAANPNMGYYSSPVVTFLMSLFNIRLGWWLGNTGKTGDKEDRWGKKFYTKPSPSIAVLPLINETFGRTDENKRYLNITDGGHFENLAIYEMVLRRAKLIVVSDAAADENFTFGEISNAIEKCKVDLGVDIKFTNGINIFARYDTEKTKKPRQRFAIAEIIYPETIPGGENHTGYLLYIRPTFYGNESTDIKHYANLNKTFPHQSTGDQLYDEKQFEAYRALGFFTMEEIIEKLGVANFMK